MALHTTVAGAVDGISCGIEVPENSALIPSDQPAEEPNVEVEKGKAAKKGQGKAAQPGAKRQAKPAAKRNAGGAAESKPAAQAKQGKDKLGLESPARSLVGAESQQAGKHFL